jgi:ketosteroid isomerase-like protein
VAARLARDVQEAFDAAVGGDVEPLGALLGDDVDWRGLERGRWLWRRASS